MINQDPNPTPSSTITSVSMVPIGGIAQVLRSGDAYKAIGELVQRSIYTALSAAFPRNGSFSAVSLAVNANTAVAFGNGVFVIVGNSNQALVSNDATGSKFATVNLPTSPGSVPAICFGNGLFVILASGTTAAGSNIVLTSPNGRDWTQATLPVSAYWTSITYGGGLFVAVSGTSANTSQAALSSPDAITWTQRTLPNTAGWSGVAYGAGVYVAVGSGGAAATSANGTTWAAKTLPLGAVNYTGIAFGSSNGVSNFVAVNSGVANQVAYSSSGTGSWSTATTTTTVTTVQCITYGNGVFLANSNPSGVIASYDAGVTWKYFASPATVSAIGYGVGTFIGVNSGATGGAYFYAENLTDSDYMYLSGTAGQFVRVK